MSTTAQRPIADRSFQHRRSPAVPFVASVQRHRQVHVLRFFSDTHFLKAEDVEKRVLSVIKNFQKVDAAAVTKDSQFRDLGLDSLDEVELGLEVENEFAIEIPDNEMENVHSIPDFVKLICSHPTAK